MTIDPWIRESNLIEDIDSAAEDKRSQRAWNWFRKQELNTDTILKIHKLITKKQLPPEQSGEFRTCQVWVADREGKPWREVPALVDAWAQYWNWWITCSAATPDTIAVLVQMAHVEFEKIHPFVDGNGRTGRMILNWQRVNFGLPVLCIKLSERSKYYELFR